MRARSRCPLPLAVAACLSAACGSGPAGGTDGGTDGGGGGCAAGSPCLTVLAGAPSGAGSADGSGPDGRFHEPQGVAVDAAGNVYVADSDNCAIRKVTPAGQVTTLAGTAGLCGTADGTGPAARFWLPISVAVDGSGNVYVSDNNNQTIRKVTPAGEASTFAGRASTTGSNDGTGQSALFRWPGGVALDGSGNLFVADAGNHTIRKISPAGEVTTLAGSAGESGSADGSLSEARFNGPVSVAVDGSGNVYVADSGNYTIRKITPGGAVSTLAGVVGQRGSADGTGSAARFAPPYGLAVDGSGNLYVADGNNDAIRKVTPAGAVTTLAGSAESRGSADGAGSEARFSQPMGVAVDAAGNVYVAEEGNSTVRKVTPAGVVSTLAGTPPQPGMLDGVGPAARFSEPRGVAVDGSGNTYVADTWTREIRKVTPQGSVTTLTSLSTGPSGQDYPTSVAVDGSGNVYVALPWDNVIGKVTPAGAMSVLAGEIGQRGSADGAGSQARFYDAEGVAVDRSGNVYVADTINFTIRKITPAGVVSTLAGTPRQAGSADGPGAAATFYLPEGVAVDGSGNVYVADSGNDTIREISPAGVVTTLAGAAGQSGTADGTGDAARFYSPRSVALDVSGNVYVADQGNSTIRRVTPAGEVTTVVGVPMLAKTVPGPLPATLAWPMGVAVDPTTGDLLVALEDAVLRVTW